MVPIPNTYILTVIINNNIKLNKYECLTYRATGYRVIQNVPYRTRNFDFLVNYSKTYKIII